MITKEEYIKKWKDLFDFIVEILCEPVFELVSGILIILVIVMLLSVKPA
jgi:hypothetical protein